MRRATMTMQLSRSAAPATGDGMIADATHAQGSGGEPARRGATARRGGRSWGLFALATVVGLWLGVTAPSISPVRPPAPLALIQPAPASTSPPVATQ